jgi:Domain of unknown function (DUF4384)
VLLRRPVPVLALAATLCSGLIGASCADSTAELPLQVQLFKRGGSPVALVSGDDLSPGDELYLKVTAHRALYLYVISEDAAGERRLIFPCRTWSRSRALGAGRLYRLPPPLLGRETFWPVGSVTSRERLRVIASVRALELLESTVAAAENDPPCAAPITDETSRRIDGLLRRREQEVSISTYELRGTGSHG